MFRIFLFVIISSTLLAQTPLPISTPEAEGIGSEKIISFLDAANNSGLEFHSIMIVRNGKKIAEGWWKPYGKDTKHMMYSVSKSFTATAIGLLQSEGKINVHDKVISFFPDQLPPSVSENLAKMSIQHLLIMSVGMAKEPGLSMVGDDWVKSFLATKIDYEPGTRFLYNSAATYVLSAIVQKVTGEKVIDYLKPRLFNPLGIVDMDWEEDPKGINVGGWGLRIKTEDMAKFGLLFLQKGKWNGNQILPEKWVEEATKVHIIQNPSKTENLNDWEQGYGYQMWRGSHNHYRADGAFGQYIIQLPEKNAVVVITSEMNDMGKGMKLVWDYLVPAFEDKALPKSKKVQELKKYLKSLDIKPIIVNKNSPKYEVKGLGKFQLEEGKMMPFDAISISDDKKNCSIALEQNSKSHSFVLGKNKWIKNSTDRKGPNLAAQAKNSQEGLAPFATYGSCTWLSDNELQLSIKYIEGPHTEKILCTFNDDKVSVKYETIMTDKRNPPVFVGTLVK
jgi:CubicO group peptidase (beta-lactamase class C family)